MKTLSINHKSLLWPILIFAIMGAIYLSIALYYQNSMMFKPVWDIKLYQSIADSGYNVRPCIPGQDYPMGDICGNVGWFPGWPATVAALSLGYTVAGILILPYVFALSGFILFFAMMRQVTSRASPCIATTALAAFPTAFYFILGFPYALLLALMSAYLLLLYRPNTRFRVVVLPFLGIWISLCYPTAFLLAIVPLVKSIREYLADKTSRSPASLIKSIFLYSLPLALGPLLLSLYYYFTFDNFFLLLEFQEKFDRTWQFPWAVIWESLSHFRFESNTFYMDPRHTYYLANFMLIWFGLVFILFYPYRVKAELVIFALAVFLFSPATGTVFSIWRHYLLMLPTAMIIAASPRPRWFKLVYIALGALLALFVYFPQFLKSYLV